MFVKCVLTALILFVALLTVVGAGCVVCMDELPRWVVLMYGASLPLSGIQVCGILNDIWHGHKSAKV